MQQETPEIFENDQQEQQNATEEDVLDTLYPYTRQLRIFNSIQSYFFVTVALLVFNSLQSIGFLLICMMVQYGLHEKLAKSDINVLAYSLRYVSFFNIFNLIQMEKYGVSNVFGIVVFFLTCLDFFNAVQYQIFKQKFKVSKISNVIFAVNEQLQIVVCSLALMIQLFSPMTYIEQLYYVKGFDSFKSIEKIDSVILSKLFVVSLESVYSFVFHLIVNVYIVILLQDDKSSGHKVFVSLLYNLIIEPIKSFIKKDGVMNIVYDFTTYHIKRLFIGYEIHKFLQSDDSNFVYSESEESETSEDEEFDEPKDNEQEREQQTNEDNQEQQINEEDDDDEPEDDEPEDDEEEDNEQEQQQTDEEFDEPEEEEQKQTDEPILNQTENVVKEETNETTLIEKQNTTSQ